MLAILTAVSLISARAAWFIFNLEIVLIFSNYYFIYSLKITFICTMANTTKVVVNI